MADVLTCSTAEVATKLGISLARFRAIRRRLRAAGFPDPLPALRDRYDPLAIEGWLARIRGDIGSQPGTAAVGGADEVDYGAILDRRAEELGAEMAARSRPRRGSR